jgi:uncharacterized protein YndB with AHSA1/START domain
MTIAPVIKTVDVRCAPARAFELFTGRMEAWWPASHHIGGTAFEDIVIEPFAGGRWFERGEDGSETLWGKVLAWTPPGQVLLAWQLRADFTYDPEFETELEITFEPHGAGTRVRVEHRNLERFGAEAEAIAKTLGGGWPTIVEGFAAFTDQHMEEGV